MGCVSLVLVTQLVGEGVRIVSAVQRDPVVSALNRLLIDAEQAPEVVCSPEAVRVLRDRVVALIG